MFELETLLLIIPGLPLLAAVLAAVFGPTLLRERTHLVVVAPLVLSFLASLMLVREVHYRAEFDTVSGPGFEATYTLWSWAVIPAAMPGSPAHAGIGAPWDGENLTNRSADFRIDVTLRADALTGMMLAMVTFVSLLVALYAAEYMRGDRGYWRFFAYIALFVFSMTMLVSVSNFLLLYVFWEAVGVCSYLLIGFWYDKPEAAAAGKKAFLVNRIGDAGFALGIFLIWVAYGTLNFHDTPSAIGVLGQARLARPELLVGGVAGTAICLMLFVGACGKSAQFPLHVWLPDAMEGPTPVSALIHAATMVTAGVYMVARCAPLFMVSPVAQAVVAGTGGFTALLAGIIALTQTDLKRILAYSTISQLGYMFLGLGTGSPAGIVAGMFHLFTHAFFKALLFLGAGSVMHAMGGVIDIRRFSGLRRIMPVTCWTFVIGSLALAGLFPFAGFWSKDAILGAVHDRVGALEAFAHGTPEGDAAEGAAVVAPAGPSSVLPPFQKSRLLGLYRALYYSALVTAALTAFYTFRAFFVTFFGPLRTPAEAEGHAHESPPTMTWPLVVLATCSVCSGFLFAWRDGLGRFLAEAPPLAHRISEVAAGASDHGAIAAASTITSVLGIALAAFFYLGPRTEAAFLAQFFGPLHALSRNKFYLDELYAVVIIWPLELIAAAAEYIDRFVVDGLVDLVGGVPKAVSRVLRPLQTGLVQFYALAMVLGLLVLVASLLTGSSWVAG